MPNKPNYNDVIKAVNEGEAGDAELFSLMYKKQLVYDHSRKEWYIWMRQYWKNDLTGAVYGYITRDLAAEYLSAAATAHQMGSMAKNGQTVSDLLIKRAAELRNRRRVDNVLSLATHDMGLTGDEWDKNPYLLAVENGVIDLKTGTLSPGNPADYIRVHAPVIWEGLDMPCPTWEKFQEEISGDDLEIIDFKQRLFGYSITGETIEHILPILFGDGRNGKSTELETLGSILGSDLSTTSDADTLMDTNKAGDGPKPFVYALRGKRFVWAKESNEGRRINTGLVKELTGGDTLTVRDMYSRPVTFKPSHTVLLMTNNKPHVSAEDIAIWDRIILIPYEQRFIDNPQKPNERKVDKRLKNKLADEYSGILAWLVRGCLEWQRQGLVIPKKLQDATNDYKNSEDTITQFIDECCKIGNLYTIRAKDLYTEYRTWAIDNGEHPMSGTSFGKKIKKRFIAIRSNGIYYQGIGI